MADPPLEDWLKARDWLMNEKVTRTSAKVSLLLQTGMVGLAFFVTGLGWSGLALLLSNRAGLERAGPGWQLLTKTGLQGFSQA